MKIAVITLHRVRNYGSSLQTLATQIFFQEKGYDVEIIDYYPERYHSLGLLKRLKNKSNKFKNPIILFCAKIIISISYFKKKVVFDKFLKKEILLTPKTYLNENDLQKNPPVADLYCTGSDQVWNSLWNEGIDRPLYLSFVENNKYCFSFASSIGNSVLDSKEIDEIIPLLAKYNRISVREDKGVEILNSIGINNVTQILDPTLLFDETRWNKYLSKKKYKKKYVVTYNLHHDKKIDEYARKLAKDSNIKLFNISYNFHDFLKKGKLKWCPTIQEYLSLIKNAEYIVTDSFHATVFSIIFHKKFITIYPKDASSRMRSILELLSLKNRGFDSLPEVDDIRNEIDYSVVDNLLEDERKKTFDFFDKIISDNKENIYEKSINCKHCNFKK